MVCSQSLAQPEELAVVGQAEGRGIGPVDHLHAAGPRDPNHRRLKIGGAFERETKRRGRPGYRQTGRIGVGLKGYSDIRLRKH